MATRSTKGGTSAAQKPPATSKKRRIGAPPPPTPPMPPAPGDGIDPPIIIQGGGSVTIYSTTPLTTKPTDPKFPKHLFVLYIPGVDIATMEWDGITKEHGHSKGGKDFTLNLFK